MFRLYLGYIQAIFRQNSSGTAPDHIRGAAAADPTLPGVHAPDVRPRNAA